VNSMAQGPLVQDSMTNNLYRFLLQILSLEALDARKHS